MNLYYWIEPEDGKPYPSCPVCGNDNYEFVYKDIDNRVVGCSECVRTVDAEDYAEEVDNGRDF